MEIRVELCRLDGPAFEPSYLIYEEAFSPNTRLPRVRVIDLMTSSMARWHVLKNGEDVLGFALVYILQDGHVAWLDYFAIRKDQRSKGLGRELLLGLLKYLQTSPSRIAALLLEIAGEERQRVKEFYGNLGARQLNEMYYLFPGYHGAGPIQMDLLAFPFQSQKSLPGLLLAGAIREVYERVHGRGGDDAILQKFIHQVPKSVKLIAIEDL